MAVEVVTLDLPFDSKVINQALVDNVDATTELVHFIQKGSSNSLILVVIKGSGE